LCDTFFFFSSSEVAVDDDPDEEAQDVFVEDFLPKFSRMKNNKNKGAGGDDKNNKTTQIAITPRSPSTSKPVDNSSTFSRKSTRYSRRDARQSATMSSGNRLSAASGAFRSILASSSVAGYSSVRGQTGQHSRLRILALHGKQSNSDVTKVQLQNLSITEDKYDITFLDGIINEDRPDPELEEFFNGPFYSWFHGSYTDARFAPSLLKAVAHVYKVIALNGPFDVIYGFSQGATVATMVAAAFSDVVLRQVVIGVAGTFGRAGARMSYAVQSTSSNQRRSNSKSIMKKSLKRFSSIRGSAEIGEETFNEA